MIPLNNCVLISQESTEEKTKTGIVLADSNELIGKGKVVASDNEGIKEGDMVVYKKTPEVFTYHDKVCVPFDNLLIKL